MTRISRNNPRMVYVTFLTDGSVDYQIIPIIKRPDDNDITSM